MADPSITGTPYRHTADEKEKIDRHSKAQIRSVSNEYAYHRHRHRKNISVCLLQIAKT